MRASFSAVLPIALCALALGMGGCAHDPDAVISGALADMGRSSQPVVYADAAPASEPVAWEAPVVHEAGFVADAGGPYLLDTGDKLRVFVYGQPNLSRAYTVDQEGMIMVPLINEVRARGRTTRDVEETIRRRLGSEFVRDPQVTVDVLQNRPFFIYGEVRTGGQFPFVSGMTVETAIAIAGGYTERASMRSFRLTRKNGPVTEQLDVPGDFPVLPGDIVHVNERFF